jgi:hypothetical protein
MQQRFERTRGCGLPAATLADVIDIDNFGDGRDLWVTFNRPAGTAGIAEFRIIVAKTAMAGFDAVAAAALDPSRYLTVPAAGTQIEYGLHAGNSGRGRRADRGRCGVPGSRPDRARLRRHLRGRARRGARPHHVAPHAPREKRSPP